MGAGGGRCDGARVELRRPGLSAGGVGISIDFSAGRGTGDGVGATFGAIGAAGALPAFAGVAMAEGGLAGGFEVGLMVVPGVDLGFAVDTATGFLTAALGTGLSAGLATGFAAFVTALLFAGADLTTLAALTAFTALTAAFGAPFTAGFLPATGLGGAFRTGLTAVFALPAFSTGFATGFAAGFATGLAVALLFRPVLAAALAGATDFFVTAFTGCLLWEAASG